MLAPCSILLYQYFEPDVLKATLASDGVIGAMGSPFSQASSYILMHHVMGDINGKNNWYYVKSGMGAISQYIEKLALQRGVDIRVNSSVDEIITSGRSNIRGVRLADGTVIEAPVVISNTTHQGRFKKMIKDQSVIPN
jgi:phytoene dehydrogenase-like protein